MIWSDLAFGLGIIVGVIVSILLIVTIICFRYEFDIVCKDLVLGVDKLRPGVIRKGFVVEPDSEIDEARQEIIERNSENGLDTPIDDLRV